MLLFLPICFIYVLIKFFSQKYVPNMMRSNQLLEEEQERELELELEAQCQKQVN